MKRIFLVWAALCCSLLHAQTKFDLSYAKGSLPVSRLQPIGISQCLQTSADGSAVLWAPCPASGGGSGTVTTFSAGLLSPLFTTSVSNASTTPGLTFSLSSAAAHTFFGNNTATPGAPGYVSITAADLPGTFAANTAATVHQFFSAYNSSTGAFTKAQPDYSDLTGTPALAVSLANVAHKWLNSYSSVTGLFTQTQPATSDLSDFPAQATNAGKFLTTDGSLLSWGSPGGAGTVTSFSAGNLSPLFTSSVATATSTPALSFSLSTAAAHTFFGNNTGVTAAPGFQAIGNGDLPGAGQVTINTTSPLGGGGTPVALGGSITITCSGCLTSVTAHNLLSATHGDTTAGTVATGDVITGQASKWARLGGNTSATPQYLKSLGTGAAANAPAWGQVAYTDLSGVPSTFTPTAHNLLSTAHGDTTAGTVSRGDIITGQGVSATWSRLGKGAASQCLQMDGTATDVVWAACGAGGGGTGTVTNTLGALTAGQLVVGNGAADVTVGNLSGDVTTAGSMAATVAAVNGVTYPAAPSTHQTPVITAANTATYKTLPDCQDSAGNHLNYTQSSDSYNCGTTSSGLPLLGCASLAVAGTTLGPVSVTGLKIFLAIYIAGYSGGDAASLQFNASGGTAYRYRWLTSAAGATSFTAGLNAISTDRIKIGAATTTNSRNVDAIINNSSAVTEKLVMFINGVFGTGNAATQATLDMGNGAWVSGASTVITSISIISTSNMLAGSKFCAYQAVP